MNRVCYRKQCLLALQPVYEGAHYPLNGKQIASKLVTGRCYCLHREHCTAVFQKSDFQGYIPIDIRHNFTSSLSFFSTRMSMCLKLYGLGEIIQLIV